MNSSNRMSVRQGSMRKRRTTLLSGKALEAALSQASSEKDEDPFAMLDEEEKLQRPSLVMDERQKINEEDENPFELDSPPPELE